MTIQLSRVSIDKFASIQYTSSKAVQTVEIPSAYVQQFQKAVNLPALTFEVYSTGFVVYAVKQQIQELIDNPGYKWYYVNFPAGFQDAPTGFYLLSKSVASPSPQVPNYMPFKIDAVYQGNQSTHRIGTYWWGNAAETITGFTGLTPNTMISLPNGATNIVGTVVGTRATAGGASISILYNPTDNFVTYNMPNPLTTALYGGECKVFDTIVHNSPGYLSSSTSLNESLWQEVLSPYHNFQGDMVLHNGLIRWIINPALGFGSSPSLYCYDPSFTRSWIFAGSQAIYDATANAYALSTYNLIRFSPEEIWWQEMRQFGQYSQPIVYTMRRGAYHIRARMLTSANGGVSNFANRMLKTGGFATVFNAGATAPQSGSGALAIQNSSNYECGYSNTDPIITGYALTNKPTIGQPTFVGSADGLDLSNVVAASTQLTYFIFTFPQATGANMISNGDMSTFPGTWTVAPGGGTIVADTTTFHSAPQSVKITTAGGTPPQLSQIPGGTNNTAYTLTFWARGDGTMDLGVLVQGTVGFLLQNFVNTTTGNTSSTWQQFTYAFTTPSNFSLGSLHVYFQKGAAVSGSAWVDDVTLTPTGNPVFNIGNARTAANAIALEAIESVNQETILIPAGQSI